MEWLTKPQPMESTTKSELRSMDNDPESFRENCRKALMPHTSAPQDSDGSHSHVG
jgi:hypothetical protein